MYAPKNTSNDDFEKHPPGQVALVCTRIIDKGTVWNEKKQKDERKISIAYESSKLMETGDFAGQPFLVFANFNYSMYQNSMMCKHIEAQLGRKFTDQAEADKFDIESLLRTSAFANITHSDDGKWVNIGSIMPLPEGMKSPEPMGEVYAFDMDNISMEVYEKLSDGMKANIQKAQEWPGNEVGEAQKHNDMPEDIATGRNYDERNPPPQEFDDKIPF